MTKRLNPFANVADIPAFQTKQRPDAPIAKDAIDGLAEANNFPSRQPRNEPRVRRRKPRVYRTGRNQNFSLKVSASTQDRFYQAADEREVTLGRLLELALDALEKQGWRGAS